MYGIFMQCFVAMKLYGGNGVQLAMFLLAAVYVIATEKDIKKKILIGIIPLLIFAGFLVPYTKMVYVKLFKEGTDTYYRVLWLVPMYVTIGYAAVSLIMRLKKSAARRIAIAIVLAFIAVTGSLVYTNQYMSKAENLYHIPQHVINICDRIAPAEGEPRVRAAFPSELVHFIRQYDTNILMPFGREMVVPQWDYYNAVYEVMEKPEVIDADALLEATRQTKCRYIILATDREIDADLTSKGLTLLDTIDGYYIYEDPETGSELYG